jgi:5-methylcytosine-specific restriction endonuclease McrA
MDRARNNARRARKRAAEVAGPVPASVYAAIRAEGPCVYCGAPADTVEHITPLARGGWECPDNLVPACASCNSSKGPKLLTEWMPDRVAYAVRISSKVAAVYAAEMENMA